jgi:hypothetical protein
VYQIISFTRERRSAAPPTERRDPQPDEIFTLHGAMDPARPANKTCSSCVYEHYFEGHAATVRCDGDPSP